MKQIQHIFVIPYLLIIVTLASGMHKENQSPMVSNRHWLYHVQEIGENFRRAQYGTEDELIVLDDKGNFFPMDLKTQKNKYMGYFKQLDFQKDLILQRNNKEIMMAWAEGLAIYDKKTPDEGYSYGDFCHAGKGALNAFAWDPLKRVVFLSAHATLGIYQWNYKARECELIMNNEVCQKMAIHSEKKVMCITNYRGNISFYDTGNAFLKIKNIQFDPEMRQCRFCRYSPDGSCVVVGNDKKIIIVDPNKDIDKFPCLEMKVYETFENIAFHPNGSILAILCTRNSTGKASHQVYKKYWVQYWNFKTQQLIKQKFELAFKESYDFDFSGDGCEMVIVLDGKCVRSYVYFAMKEKCIYPLFLLNQIKEKMKEEVDLPQEIVRYVGSLFFELLRKF